MVDVKKRKVTKKPLKPKKFEAPRRFQSIERGNSIPKLSEDIQFLLAGRGVTHPELGDIAVSVARLVNFAMPNGVMYDASVKLAEFVGVMNYAPPGLDQKAVIRLRKAAQDCGFDWGQLCNKSDTVLSIAADNRLKELDQLIFDANNDLIAIHEMQRKYAKLGGSNVSGGNAIKRCLQKMDAERETLITRFPELVDDEPQERHHEGDEE